MTLNDSSNAAPYPIKVFPQLSCVEVNKDPSFISDGSASSVACWTSMLVSDLSALLYWHASTIATLRSPVCPTPH